MTNTKRMIGYFSTAMLGMFMCSQAMAEVEQFVVDPSHTYPAFEADHMGGLSLWRGKFNKTKGTLTLDRDQKTGTVDIEIDAASIDFGLEKMNEHARGADLFNVAKYPTVRYVGQSMRFENGQPVEVLGELTLLGVTRPLNLKINQFLCKMHPFAKRQACGADAEAHFKRSDFGLSYGIDMGFKPEVTVRISIEAIRQN